MTKEELEKKAAAYAKKHRMLSYCGAADTYISDEKEVIKAILHFAEPMLKDLEKAKELIKELYDGLDKLYLSGLSDKQIAFIEKLQDKVDTLLEEEE